jgi:hypothetical protein
VAPVGPVLATGSAKRVGGAKGEIPGKVVAGEPWEGENPREQPAVGELSPVRRQGLPEGLKPRNRGPWGRPTASAAGKPTGETVRGSFCRGNAADTFREEEAPKGESHERRRRETKPARARRA